MRVIIIGGVVVGMSVVVKLKRIKFEYEVVVYEKIEIVFFGVCGLLYFVGGFFNDVDELLVRILEKFREVGIDLNIFREVVEVDSEFKKIKVKNIKIDEIYEDYYDKLMIVIGVRSIMFFIKNIKLKNVFILKSLYDGEYLKKFLSNEDNKRVIIIGVGFIGLEVVEVCKKLGKDVDVI